LGNKSDSVGLILVFIGRLIPLLLIIVWIIFLSIFPDISDNLPSFILGIITAVAYVKSRSIKKLPKNEDLNDRNTESLKRIAIILDIASQWALVIYFMLINLFPKYRNIIVSFIIIFISVACSIYSDFVYFYISRRN